VPIRPDVRFAALALVLLACGGGAAPSNTAPAAPVSPPPPREPVRPFIALPFAGQHIAVTPITLLIPLDTLARIAPLSDRALALAWADSLVASHLTGRRPEVIWVLPAELRKMARRAPTVAPDPDRMGQSLLRDKKFETVPDPLRGQLRSLMAIVGGRYAMVPAAVTLVPDAGLVRAEVSFVLADSRTGKVVWRTVTWGIASSPAAAVSAAMEALLPV
jgi:hypothetical protein